MAKFLQLKHTHIGYEQPEYKFYFYEGEADVHYGVIDLPLDPNFEHWAIRAWLKGYRLDPETGEEVTRDDIVARLNGETTVTPEPEPVKEPVKESTKSAGDKVEGTTARRQPARRNGVRSRQSTRK